MEKPTLAESYIDLKKATDLLQATLPQAGEILRNYFYNRNFKTQQKAGVDFTTQADIEIDQFLRDQISKRFPDHQFLTEETAPRKYSHLIFSSESNWSTVSAYLNWG